MANDEIPFDDDEPVDPNAHEFDDADEGADDNGTPITSLNGSETAVWGE
jgi:hypothetical protein